MIKLDDCCFYNEDCIEGAKKNIKNDSVDLIITDPPYGIGGDKLHKHYNRKEKYVLNDYVEVPIEMYQEFTQNWIEQAHRILKPGGSIYAISGYTNLPDVLNSLRSSGLVEVNHIIWKYNFGVYTRKKYVSSHYHILYYIKPGVDSTFNTFSRYGANEKKEDGKGALNYLDREDVWFIQKEYKPGQSKNKNELPRELLKKIIQYSSNEEDLICDLFLGGFSTAKVALEMNRKVIGFELGPEIFEHQMEEIKKVEPGCLLKGLRVPEENKFNNQNQPWSQEEKERVKNRFDEILPEYGTKRKTIDQLSQEFGRGYFSILNVLNG